RCLDLGAGQLDVVGYVAGLAVRTDAAHETLRKNEIERARDVERLQSHIQQTRNGFRRRVGVQGAHDEVTRESCLDRDAAGFEISNLTDHDDVRILAQEGFQRRGEAHADLGAYLNLIDAVKVVLDGVFGGHDVDIDRVHLGQRGIQRSRLTRTGWSRDEHHAVRILNRFHQLALCTRLDAEGLEIEGKISLVENTQYDLLTEQSGKRRDAEVDDLAADLELDASVLRDASLCDVQAGHDLEARDESRAHLERRFHYFAKHAVDAIANAQLLLETLEVDVRRALVQRVGENRIDELDDWRFVDCDCQRRSGHLLLLFLDHLDVFVTEVDVVEKTLHSDVSHRFFGIHSLDHRAQSVLASDHGIYVRARAELQIVDDANVRRVRHRHVQHTTFALERKHEMLNRDLGGNEPNERGIDVRLCKIDGGDLVLTREQTSERQLLDHSQLDERVAESPAVAALFLQRLRELFTGDEAFGNKESSDALRALRDWRNSGRHGLAAAFRRPDVLTGSGRGRMTVFRGRGMRENVTLGASFLKVLAERNGTRCNSPNEPNGPNESRSATIRRAIPLGSTPIASISDIVARSRSIIEFESRMI